MPVWIVITEQPLMLQVPQRKVLFDVLDWRMRVQWRSNYTLARVGKLA